MKYRFECWTLNEKKEQNKNVKMNICVTRLDVIENENIRRGSGLIDKLGIGEKIYRDNLES